MVNKYIYMSILKGVENQNSQDFLHICKYGHHKLNTEVNNILKAKILFIHISYNRNASYSARKSNLCT